MPKLPKISLHIFAVSPEKHELWNKFFFLQINTKSFYKLIVSLWVCMARHAESTQNNNFIISLQYLKEHVKDGVDFSPLIIVKRFFKVILSFFMCVATVMKKLTDINQCLTDPANRYLTGINRYYSHTLHIQS